MAEKQAFYSEQLAHMHQLITDAIGADLEHITVEQAVLGVFFCGVSLSTGTAGLCATPMMEIPEAICCPSSAKAFPTPGKQSGKKITALLKDLYSPFPLRRAVALAGLNALAEYVSRHNSDEVEKWTIRQGDAFDALTIHPDSKVVLVGAFPPYMRKLRKMGIPFSLMELNPSILKPEETPYLVSGTEAAARLNEADIAIITGTTLLNGSFDQLISQLSPQACAALIGPTVPILPAVFSHTPVKILGGVSIHDPSGLLKLLAEAGSGYHFFQEVVERITLVSPSL